METHENDAKALRRAALAFILLMGVVSLFSDVTHEGGKSILGAYLSLAGAPAVAIGFVAGLGDLVGYALRFLSGRLADRTHKYWTLTLTGYAIDLLAVPALALIPENGWIWAAALIMAERFGKAVKKPAKDTLLSFAASQNGVGRSFALQEFLDQLGAFAGPVMLFLVMSFKGSGNTFADYRRCFALLLIPAAATLALLLTAKKFFPHPENFEPEAKKSAVRPTLDGNFRLYLLGTGLFALGFFDFSIITMHVARTSLMSPEELPLLYAGAMAVDAFAALLFGELYDRFGLKSLAWSTLAAAPFAALVFLAPSRGVLFFGAALWGIGMGAQESTLKAAVATLVPRNFRSFGYGLFQAAFGVCLFFGSWMGGWLYDRSLLIMAAVSASVQVLAALVFARIKVAKSAE
ncbi:MAG: MFS transporter [Pyramidobacter sp.]|jgi:MFS family permease